VRDPHREYDVSEVNFYNWINALTPVKVAKGLMPQQQEDAYRINIGS